MDARVPDERMLGESPAFLRMMEHVSRVAPLDKPVLIVGERGTGKELVAARLHYLSGRWDGPYQKLNCAAIAETLLESELFGHESGAFTGASKRHVGRFERADGGTLFLDELATTSASVQEKILRLVEYGEFERVGGERTLAVNVRLVAATNEDLPTLADRGDFRHDLLDRLSFDVITLPPLRARPEDVLLLAEHFAVGMSRELGRDFFAGFSPEARETLLAHPWPGNVRELRNVVERSVYRHEDPEAPLDVIVVDPFESDWRPTARRDRRGDTRAPRAEPREGARELPESVLAGPFRDRVRAFETHLLRRALLENRHNQRRTAAALGLTYDQLRGYLRKYDLTPAASRADG